MQKFKNFIMKFGSSFAALALIIGISTSNSACMMVFISLKNRQLWTIQILKEYGEGKYGSLRIFLLIQIWSYIER